MAKFDFKSLCERERLGILTGGERNALRAMRQRGEQRLAEIDAQRKAERSAELDEQLETDARVSRAQLSRSTANACWADRVRAYRKKHGCTEAQAIIALMS